MRNFIQVSESSYRFVAKILHALFKFKIIDYEKKYKNFISKITPEHIVRWLGMVDVHCRYKDVNKKAIEAFNELYPQYKGYVCVF